MNDWDRVEKTRRVATQQDVNNEYIKGVLWIIAGYLVTRRISQNDSLMGNLGPVIFFGFIIFFASFELLEWISREICQTTGN